MKRSLLTRPSFWIKCHNFTNT